MKSRWLSTVQAAFLALSLFAPAAAGAPRKAAASEAACTPPHAGLLQDYRIRPNWPVAGVDYCVGVDPQLALKDPATIAMPGIALDRAKRIVTVTGSDVTLDGHDFARDGGWQIFVQGARTRIANSSFAIGANGLTPIISSAAAADLIVSRSTIEGNNRDVGWGGLISYRGKSFTVEYCWLKNAGGDMIQQIDGGQNSRVIVRNNLIEQGGMSPGAHGDYTQLAGGPFSVSIIHNTTLQNGGTTQGLMTEFVSDGEIAFNTMIGTVSYFTSLDLSYLTGTIQIHDNYFDSRGYGFLYPVKQHFENRNKASVRSNVNMRSGSAQPKDKLN